MKKYEGFLITFVFAAVLLFCFPVLRADAANEITKSGDAYYCYNSAGEKQTGLVTVNGQKYYFDLSSGKMKHGWVKVDGKRTYYADPNSGVLWASKWVDNTYYLQSNCKLAVSTWVGNKWVNSKGKYSGTRKTGWVTLEGNKYYYKTKTKYATGWFKVDNKYYYADSKGVLQTKQWIGKYYVNSNGKRVTNTKKTIKGKTYIFKSNGKKYTNGWVKYKNKYYYVDKSGVVAKSKWIGKRYVDADGVRLTGWQKIGGKKYYLKSNGKKATGVYTVKKKKYYFNSSGVLQKGGWVSDKYYANSKGVLQTGLQTINGEIYYFNKNTCKKVTSKFKKVNSNKYYFMPGGEAARNMRIKINSSFYYFGSNGKMVKNKWVNQYYYGSTGAQTKYRVLTGWYQADNSSDKYYYVNQKVVTGWYTIDGDKYYFNSKGVMQTGIQTISGKKYYFGTDGKMQKSTTVIVGSVEYTINSSGVVTSEKSITVSGSSKGVQIANFAIKYVGNPYVYGGTSLTNGADCSGFVQTVFANFGYKLLRTADEQMKGPSSSQIKSGYTKGTSVTVSKSSLQPGDLLFYGTSSYASHVAIYIGDGQIVHASNSQPYPKGGIKISNWDYDTPVKAMRYWS